MEMWIELISNLGFPIAITLFVLLRVEGSIKDLSQRIDVLTEEIRKSED